MDSDEDDFVFYGTPIAREDDVTTSRKKKSIAEASGQLRTLAPWKQEVRDEEGRRRFHGAFSGGFSAGYYNTVGSKEGWTPQTFVSSRKNRAEVKQQDILNFLDDDERAELEGQSLKTSSQFDTFGFTAADHARKHAEKEQQKRPSAIPGPVPDELVLPATDSIGVKLLLKMGWRRGRSIKDSHADVAYDARREARKAFLAFSTNDAKTQQADLEPSLDKSEYYTEQPASDDVQSSQSTPVYVLNPKQDLHGLGFDPFKNAAEFREKKRSRISENRGPGNKSALLLNNNLFGLKSGKSAPGFGIGALEDFDAEDEDVYGSGYDFEETYVDDVDEPMKLIMDSKQKSVQKEPGALSGFKIASNTDYQLERFDPPVVPKDFVPHHKFSSPPETSYKLGDPGPPEIPPPQDNNLKLLIDGVATLVARCGKLFEDLSREKNQSNPMFSFLVGGHGHEYYGRKLWEELQKRGDQAKLQLDGKLSPRTQKMTAEGRGKILGEKPLERSSKDLSTSIPSKDAIHLQYNLSDTFTDPSSYSEMPVVAKPFMNDPAKQERFEQFLKDKYQGGLRSTESGRASHMSEAARALERLDFEVAAEAIKKGKWSKEISTSLTGGMEFTSGGFVQAKDTQAEDVIPKEVHVKRTEYQWHPSPILCKRFDLTDPYMGKPPPAPRSRSKIDTLIFTSNSGKETKEEKTIIVKRDSYQISQPEAQGTSKDVADDESGGEVEVETVERPVDLYKAIFSDDSDDEEDISIPNEVGNPEKKVDAANTTLNRLIAGDFLESLGKELGLEVPQELPSSTNKAMSSAPPKENASANSRIYNTYPVEDIPSSTLNVPHSREIIQDHTSANKEPVNGNFMGNSARSNSKYSENTLEKGPLQDRKLRTPSRRHRSLSSSSSSEEERSRKRSRRRHRHSDSDSVSSSDHRDRYHSKSKGKKKGKKKGSSREKSSSSRSHSKHHKRRSRLP
ncbi:G patch domain-containing protein TGH [Argentina anserina]|uniref:G patch domain-containing protein TGH n=1 Tax=Argentina anserina TaxID=57926 RepID=UPI00217649C7|nr:G patch domain-containing protein TGH [Potentilla anserina]